MQHSVFHYHHCISHCAEEEEDEILACIYTITEVVDFGCTSTVWFARYGKSWTGYHASLIGTILVEDYLWLASGAYGLGPQEY